MHWLYKVDQAFEFETKTASLVSVTTSKWNFQKVYFFPLRSSTLQNEFLKQIYLIRRFEKNKINVMT